MSASTPIRPPRYSFVIAGKLEQLLEAELVRLFRARRLLDRVARRLNDVTGDDELRSVRELLGAATWDLDLIPERAFPSRRRLPKAAPSEEGGAA